jgi:nucleoside-diphosphate-sugar epimerase
MAFALHQEKKLPVTTVRLFNTVGPRQSGRYGMVVPRFVQAALKNEALTIYGDGTQSRVFCHVDDAVAAIATIAATDATIGEVFNVGGSGEISIKALAEKVIATTKSYAQDDNKLVMPGYAYVNPFLSFELTKGLSATVNVNNVFDTIGINDDELVTSAANK